MKCGCGYWIAFVARAGAVRPAEPGSATRRTRSPGRLRLPDPPRLRGPRRLPGPPGLRVRLDGPGRASRQGRAQHACRGRAARRGRSRAPTAGRAAAGRVCAAPEARRVARRHGRRSRLGRGRPPGGRAPPTRRSRQPAEQREAPLQAMRSRGGGEDSGALRRAPAGPRMSRRRSRAGPPAAPRARRGTRSRSATGRPSAVVTADTSRNSSTVSGQRMSSPRPRSCERSTAWPSCRT
jgi:hypothetical protein